MSISVDIAFVFLPQDLADRLLAGELACTVTAYEHSGQCRLVTSAVVRAGDRQNAKLDFVAAVPSWVRKGLAVRLWRGDKTFGAAIVQSATA